MSAHDPSLLEFASLLAQREGLQPRPDGSLIPEPPLQWRQKFSWPNLQRLLDTLLVVIRDRRDPLERRWRKLLAFAEECRQAKVDRLRDDQIADFVEVMVEAMDDKVPMDAGSLPRPGWIGRVLFRQFAAIYTRKDHGPNRGPALAGVWGRLSAAATFARGQGVVPRLHAWIPETTFEKLEQPIGVLPRDVEEILERYYTLKVGALQFCGPANFGVAFWEGLESLALTFPVLCWVARAFNDGPRTEAMMKALSIVDDHFGFNRVLMTLRNRMSLSILAGRGELSKLIAWYSR
jgi:lysine-N-methylase